MFAAALQLSLRRRPSIRSITCQGWLYLSNTKRVGELYASMQFNFARRVFASGGSAPRTSDDLGDELTWRVSATQHRFAINTWLRSNHPVDARRRCGRPLAVQPCPCTG